jgi:hypothetical protein
MRKIIGREARVSVVFNAPSLKSGTAVKRTAGSLRSSARSTMPELFV